MNQSAVIHIVLYLTVLFALSWPLGIYMRSLFEGRLAARWTWISKTENGLLRVLGVSPEEEMHWSRYALTLIVFNAIGVLALYALQRMQGVLPLNPAGMSAVSSHSAFNTALSFVTNTNWQGYGGESTMGHLTQMLGLTTQNFLSAATGIAVAVAFVRGFVRRTSTGIGNAWLDLTRANVWLLLPLSCIFSLFLVSQGVIQNLDAPKTVPLIEKIRYQETQKDGAGKPMLQEKQVDSQTLPMGPVASQDAIKMLGTNGGGFFNANSAHPFENPTPLTNFAQMLSIFLIPAALIFMFGHMVGDIRQGLAILAAMTVLFVLMFVVVYWSEGQANPQIAALGVEHLAGNMEGKEVRFGILQSALFATITTAASCGAVNAMHDSFMPLGGGATMWLMQLGEVVFGGVGSGLYGMLVFAILAVFLAGLMVGRTPEYLGKKIGSFEMKMVSIAILITPFLVLCGSAVALMTEAGHAGLGNPGAHGFSEVLYALSSTTNNNGSAFAGLTVDTPFYNVLLGIVMWFGRFGVIVPVLAIAGSLAAKQRLPASGGTMPTHGMLFVVLLIGAVIVVGALTYIPALALGPVAEHLQLFASLR